MSKLVIRVYFISHMVQIKRGRPWGGLSADMGLYIPYGSNKTMQAHTISQ